MSALAALARAYDRLYDRREVPAPGYSQEKIGFVIPLNEDGSPAGLPIDLRSTEGSRKIGRQMAVPASFKRPGVTPRAFFLWDNTAFALGITADEKKDGMIRLQAFRDRHLRELEGSEDAGLKALLAFIKAWEPGDFDQLQWPAEMKDQNVVFALESERIENVMIHDRPAARELWLRLSAEEERTSAACLISGKVGPIARLHPSIKGVMGAQTSGASIVSFNLDAFTSYGLEQGDNAPISEASAFAYCTALNHFLERDSGHRIQIGDATTVFWAEGPDITAVEEAEGFFAEFMGMSDRLATGKLKALLAKIRSGRPIDDLQPGFPRDVRFFVLGLSPNASRLSVRFYLEDDFAHIGTLYLQHVANLMVEPPPKQEQPTMWQFLIETATLRKSENIQPNLAGEWMRAILTGGPYPLTLLSTVIMRLRADHDINGLRVAILKSVLIRNFAMEVPVSLDPDNKDPGYLLGRLFATYEQIQSAALGRGVNATIRDKFYGAASAQPRKVFPLLDKGSAPHLAKIGKDRRGYQITLERQVAQIMDLMEPGQHPFPAQLPAQQQALFALGYYHQRFFQRPEKSTAEEASA